MVVADRRGAPTVNNDLSADGMVATTGYLGTTVHAKGVYDGSDATLAASSLVRPSFHRHTSLTDAKTTRFIFVFEHASFSAS